MIRAALPRIALPTRMQGSCVDRDNDNKCWRLWLHTVDWKYGTQLVLYDDGRAVRVTIRDDGDEEWEINT